MFTHWLSQQDYQLKNYFLVELNNFSFALRFLLNSLSVSSEYLTELYDLGAETSYIDKSMDVAILYLLKLLKSELIV